jgi:uncharacterized ion transporter superfamily protein YfcC
MLSLKFKQRNTIVNFETFLHPTSILFVIGFIFGLMSPQFQNRHKMMFCKFLGDTLVGIYIITLGGYSGGCAAMIAATGALTQALTPHKYLRKTILLRISIAIILSLASIYFVYKHPLDLLPLAMVIICRFGELQSQAQRIRLVYFVTAFPWMIYHFMNSFYLPLFATIIGATSMFFAMLRHHKRQKQESIT